MNKILLLLSVLFLSLNTNAQSLHVKNGGNVYDINGNKWTTKEVRDILSNNTQALKSYNQGRTKKNVGNFLLYTGISMATTNVILAYTEESVPTENNHYTFVPAIIGSVMALAAIPIKIGHTKKVKNAIELHNKMPAPQVSASATTVKIIASHNQLGFLVAF